MEIDLEILALEQRLAQRRLKVERLARAARQRAVNVIVSPAGLLGAAALGFLAVTGVMRRHQQVPRGGGRGGLVRGLAGVGASAALSFALAMVRAQFGSPAQIAQKLLLVFRRKSPAGDSRQAQYRAPFGG